MLAARRSDVGDPGLSSSLTDSRWELCVAVTGAHGGWAARHCGLDDGVVESAGDLVYAIADLDLGYTPPFGTPWDAMQLAAQAWTAATR
jgi:hypothetical protein